MCEVAGRLADGVVGHPTNSARAHIDEVMAPAISRGSAAAGRLSPPLVVAPPVITGADAESVDRARAARLVRLAFVLSTPAYESTLARTGHRNVAVALRGALREGRTDIASMVPDAVVDELAVVAPYGDLPPMVRARYGEVATGILLRPPDDTTDDGAFAEVVAELQRLG